MLGKADSTAEILVANHFAGHISKNGAMFAKCMTLITPPRHIEPDKLIMLYMKENGTETKDRV